MNEDDAHGRLSAVYSRVLAGADPDVLLQQEREWIAQRRPVVPFLQDQPPQDPDLPAFAVRCPNQSRAVAERASTLAAELSTLEVDLGEARARQGDLFRREVERHARERAPGVQALLGGTCLLGALAVAAIDAIALLPVAGWLAGVDPTELFTTPGLDGSALGQSAAITLAGLIPALLAMAAAERREREGRGWRILADLAGEGWWSLVHLLTVILSAVFRSHVAVDLNELGPSDAWLLALELLLGIATYVLSTAVSRLAFTGAALLRSAYQEGRALEALTLERARCNEEVARLETTTAAKLAERDALTTRLDDEEEIARSRHAERERSLHAYATAAERWPHAEQAHVLATIAAIQQAGVTRVRRAARRAWLRRCGAAAVSGAGAVLARAGHRLLAVGRGCLLLPLHCLDGLGRVVSHVHRTRVAMACARFEAARAIARSKAGDFSSRPSPSLEAK